MTIENINDYLFEKINKLILNKSLYGKKIVLFGLNTSSYATKGFLEKKGYDIYAYIDNDEKKRNDHNDIIDMVIKREISINDY